MSNHPQSGPPPSPTMLEQRLETAVRRYQNAPTSDAWKLVEAACAACLRFYGRLPGNPKAAASAIATDLKWRGITPMERNR